MATQDEFVRITVRLPPTLHEALENLAREHNVSLNSEMVRMLKAKVSAELSKEIEESTLTALQIPFFARELAIRARNKARAATSEVERNRYEHTAELIDAMAQRVEDRVLEDPPL